MASPLQRIFPFFAQPGNLALITPPSLGFRLLTPLPVEMEKGRIIDYTIRVIGLPIRWRTLITTYEPPRCFVDEQISGPYSFWHHTHRFEPRDGGTLLYDEVRYVLPMTLIVPVRNLVPVMRNPVSNSQAEYYIPTELAWYYQNRAFWSYRSISTNIHTVNQARHPSSAI